MPRSATVPPPLSAVAAAPAPRGSVTLLVVSDLHYSERKVAYGERLDQFLHAWKDAWRRIGPALGATIDGLVVAGDLTEASREGEFRLLEKHFLARLRELHHLDRSRVFTIPGNHDHLRDVAMEPDPPTTGARPSVSPRRPHPKLVTNLECRRDLILDPTWEHAVGSRFFLYDRWARKFTKAANAARCTASAWAHDLSSGSSDGIRLIGLNSALASTGYPDDIDGHWLGEAQVAEALPRDMPDARVRVDDQPIVVSLMHHAPDDLDEHDGGAKELLFRKSHLVIHGHHHVRRFSPATETSPAIFCAPSTGFPHPKPTDRDRRDGCALVRIDRHHVEVYCFSLAPPTKEIGQRLEWASERGPISADFSSPLFPQPVPPPVVF